MRPAMKARPLPVTTYRAMARCIGVSVCSLVDPHKRSIRGHGRLMLRPARAHASKTRGCAYLCSACQALEGEGIRMLAPDAAHKHACMEGCIHIQGSSVLDPCPVLLHAGILPPSGPAHTSPVSEPTRACLLWPAQSMASRLSSSSTRVWGSMTWACAQFQGRCCVTLLA